jgi:hypothetical protein
VATSRDGGRAFTAPVRVNSVAGDARISGEIAPRVFRRAAIAPVGGSRPPDVLDQTTSYPVMAATDAGIVAVWTSGPPDRSTIGVRVIQ